jgi:hypothetical protein
MIHGYLYMGGSISVGTPSIASLFMEKTKMKRMIWGYHHFKKPPYGSSPKKSKYYGNVLAIVINTLAMVL